MPLLSLSTHVHAGLLKEYDLIPSSSSSSSSDQQRLTEAISWYERASMQVCMYVCMYVCHDNPSTSLLHQPIRHHTYLPTYLPIGSSRRYLQPRSHASLRSRLCPRSSKGHQTLSKGMYVCLYVRMYVGGQVGKDKLCRPTLLQKVRSSSYLPTYLPTYRASSSSTRPPCTMQV